MFEEPDIIRGFSFGKRFIKTPLRKVFYLTASEAKLFRLLLLRFKEEVDYDTIGDYIWESSIISEARLATLKVHAHRVRRKLRDLGIELYLLGIRGRGYMLTDENIKMGRV